MDAPDSVNARLRQLPSVDQLLEALEVDDFSSKTNQLQRWSSVAAARAALQRAREAVLEEGSNGIPTRTELIEQARRHAVNLERGFPGRVLNATGVVLHTNLGRAPLSIEAQAAVAQAAAGYSELELDLVSGRRGSRLASVTELLCVISGAEAALVVNNNAGAVFLALDALVADRDVILSRGELVEIGGSFRVPDIMAASRARLVEVGTTNRTHLHDYRDAIGPTTGALLKVHRSNFAMSGFTKEVTLAELAPLAREHDLPLLEDRGSGTFMDLHSHGIPEAEVQRGLADGADLVLFSGDKLLGGPQAGIALGRRDLIERMKKSPLARALRIDKLTLAALHATLRVLLDGRGLQAIPVLEMLLASAADLEQRAKSLAKALTSQGVASASVIEVRSPVGGGALPNVELSGFAVLVESQRSAAELASALRSCDPPVLARVHRDALLLDPRTLTDADIELVAAAVSMLWFDSST